MLAAAARMEAPATSRGVFTTPCCCWNPSPQHSSIRRLLREPHAHESLSSVVSVAWLMSVRAGLTDCLPPHYIVVPGGWYLNAPTLRFPSERPISFFNYGGPASGSQAREFGESGLHPT